jgi:hypothetical protein
MRGPYAVTHAGPPVGEFVLGEAAMLRVIAVLSHAVRRAAPASVACGRVSCFRFLAARSAHTRLIKRPSRLNVIAVSVIKLPPLAWPGYSRQCSKVRWQRRNSRWSVRARTPASVLVAQLGRSLMNISTYVVRTLRRFASEALTSPASPLWELHAKRRGAANSQRCMMSPQSGLVQHPLNSLNN